MYKVKTNNTPFLALLVKKNYSNMSKYKMEIYDTIYNNSNTKMQPWRQYLTHNADKLQKFKSLETKKYHIISYHLKFFSLVISAQPSKFMLPTMSISPKSFTWYFICQILTCALNNKMKKTKAFDTNMTPWFSKQILQCENPKLGFIFCQKNKYIYFVGYKAKIKSMIKAWF